MAKKSKRADWREFLVDQLLQQVLALLVVALGTITLLTVLRVTRGRWVDAWWRLLRYLLGWGVYPTAVAIILAGLTWLQRQLDRAVGWRWRPFVGAEIVFFSLLALTHTIFGRGDLWGLVAEGWGGGLVGWAISAVLATYIGWPANVIVLAALLAIGLCLTFDVTFADVVDTAKEMRRRIADYRARRAAESARKRAQDSRRERPAAHEEAPPPPKPSSSSSSGAASAANRKSSGKRSGSVHITSSRRGDLSLPPLDLLNGASGPPLTDAEIRRKSRIIKETLAQFGVPVEVVEVRVGPTVTQFGVQPGFVDRPRAGERKVRVRQISSLSDDLALALATPRLRVEAPVPGRPYVGIEVPNQDLQIVGVREVMDSEEFRDLDSPLAIALGQDVAGEPVVADLGRMPHLLIAGTTGSGKSVCIKALITCLVCNNTPEELRLAMIDPKMVELVRFNGLPHLYGERP